METQIIIPKWQGKFEKSFPSEIISIVNDVPKAEMPESSSKTEGINPWIVLVVAVIGITLYVIWKQKEDAKKQ